MSDKKNIYQRLLAVISASGALPKLGVGAGQMQGKPYHKIDDTVEHLRPLFLEHRVMVLPSVVEAESVQVGTSQKGLPIFHATAQVSFTFVSADDPEDKTPPLTSFGEGLDYSDKAIGKAISYAAKACLLLMFQLRGQPDNEADEGVQGAPQGQGYRPPPPRPSRPPAPPQGQGPPPGHPAAGPPQGNPPAARTPDPKWAGELPQDGQRRDPLVDTVTTHLQHGNPQAAWVAIGDHVSQLRAKWGNRLYRIKPQQVRVFYGKAQAGQANVEQMKELVYTYCGISGQEAGVEDHLELVPSAVAPALFTLIEGGGCNFEGGG